MKRKKPFAWWNFVKHPQGKDYGFNGCMLETFGDDLEVVRQQQVVNWRQVWTILEGPGRSLYVVAGCHVVNRFGYLISEKPFEDETLEYRV